MRAYERKLWDTFVDKTLASSLLLVLTKLLSSWAIAAYLDVTVRSRWYWGFVPFAGLATTPSQFREVAQLSTSVVTAVAIVWAIWHFVTRRDRVPSRLWGAGTALPMAALLATLEWGRTIDLGHLLGTRWLAWILCVLAATGVVIAGFVRSDDFALAPADLGSASDNTASDNSVAGDEQIEATAPVPATSQPAAPEQPAKPPAMSPRQ